MAKREVELIATLTDSSGNPLSGKTIDFYYRTSGSSTWNSAGSAETDSNGKASVKIEVDAPGDYDFKAEFPGDENYEPSSTEKTNVHIKAKTVLTLEVKAL